MRRGCPITQTVKGNCFPHVFSSLSSFLPSFPRLQNSPYFCVFKYARAVKQKVWNEAENRERDWGGACKACALRALKTLTPRFTDFFTDFEKKPTVLQSNPTPLKNLVLLKQLKSCTVTMSMIHLNFSYF